METLKMILEIIYLSANEKQMRIIFLYNLSHNLVNTSSPTLIKCLNSSGTRILVVGCATSYAPLGVPLHLIGASFFYTYGYFIHNRLAVFPYSRFDRCNSFRHQLEVLDVREERLSQMSYYLLIFYSTLHCCDKHPSPYCALSVNDKFE